MSIFDEPMNENSVRPFLAKGYPTTKEEWWLLCKYHARDFSLPESMGSREIPGFHALCDLCSECHILEEQ